MTERLRDERGMTIVEGVVAVLLLALGSLATLQLFDTGNRTSFRAEQDQTLSNRLQSELEEVTNLAFPAVAMTAAPTDPSDPKDPRSRVNGAEFAVEKGGGSLEPLVVDATNGQISPSPESFTAGDISGQIYKFVVWRDDPTCSEALCPGGQDLKRVIVVARVDDTGLTSDRAYQEVHSDVVDPDAAPVDNPGPGDDPDGDEIPDPVDDCPDTAGVATNDGCPDPQPPCDTDGDGTQDAGCDLPEDKCPAEPGPVSTEGCPINPDSYLHEFFLTDTPCNQSERQPITADHATHNTRGACSAGLQTGSTPSGAPDLAFTEAVELDSGYPADQQPQYDYATDLEPSTGADADKGLFLRRPTLSGCLLGSVASLVDLPILESNRHQKIHKWVTAPMPNDFELLFTGNATLQLWTKTVNNVAQSGRICVTMFVRRTVLGLPVDIPVTTVPGLVYTSYTDTTWPTDWEEISIQIPFLTLPTILPNERIGIALQVESGSTGNDGLEFMYDHPSFESRLQVRTNRVLPF